ncbi:TetR/AcrR family transcriptional regulator [Herbiconiux sp. KACC 21604]|uniref:TetR/AcrR family transcriptional regulator n=1 Tax=unclassified Herbiconiux TaxID=2618217 RepID=UPI001492E02E|nr:TetR/AcrR family transcriptional regulator [Herbiconiux sp. SALV-R1]QJU55794.1 TetR/AcrR family transcriptional regulator [Herbiconiux sp. SALV-R1]WPO87006.1 TetR/AcrR family transcriptional regulator [Herbiconiux sp. KACC 21604]
MARTVLDRSDAVRALAGVFRTRGFDGSSLSVIQQETGIGRGSLYHFFPDGKKDMARAVLDEVRSWFDEQVFTPLRATEEATAAAAITASSRAVAGYFVSRERICLFAAMTLGEEQSAFTDSVQSYFTDWIEALAQALRTGGLAPQAASTEALDAVAAIQGGLILARAYGSDETLLGIVDRAEQRLLVSLEAHRSHR